MGKLIVKTPGNSYNNIFIMLINGTPLFTNRSARLKRRLADSIKENPNTPTINGDATSLSKYISSIFII